MAGEGQPHSYHTVAVNILHMSTNMRLKVQSSKSLRLY